MSFKINSPEKTETVDITINKTEHPIAWENKKKSLVNSGLTEDEAEADLTLNPVITMELCYDTEFGAFLVESEAVDCVDIFHPYTGVELEVEED